KARTEVLLKWCKVNIINTTQHYINAAGYPCFSSEWLKLLANIKVRLVLLNILMDDVADDVQNPWLFRVFAQIPFAPGGELAIVSAERAESLQARVPLEWRDYLMLAVDSWNSAMRLLRLLVG